MSTKSYRPTTAARLRQAIRRRDPTTPISVESLSQGRVFVQALTLLEDTDLRMVWCSGDEIRFELFGTGGVYDRWPASETDHLDSDEDEDWSADVSFGTYTVPHVARRVLRAAEKSLRTLHAMELRHLSTLLRSMGYAARRQGGGIIVLGKPVKS
jgi:hypothetical protein